MWRTSSAANPAEAREDIAKLVDRQADWYRGVIHLHQSKRKQEHYAALANAFEQMAIQIREIEFETA